MNWIEKFAALIGPVLIVFALSLISFCTYVFFNDVLPYYRHNFSLSAPAELIVTFLGVFLLFNTLYNYYRCVVTSPGIPPLATESAESGALANRLGGYVRTNSESGDEDDQGGKKSVCGKCDRIRPLRTHHCSVCKTCVMKMDHHCPWIYNCVGYGNYKFFYLFLLHLFLVDLFYMVITYPVFAILLRSNEKIGFESRSSIVMSFVLAAAVEIAVLAFLAFHTYLLLSNQTTIEFISSSPDLRRMGKFRKNQFDLGRNANWNQVFGRQGKWQWAFSFLHKEGEEGIPVFPTIGVK